jgi:hypothetical protein
MSRDVDSEVSAAGAVGAVGSELARAAPSAVLVGVPSGVGAVKVINAPSFFFLDDFLLIRPRETAFYKKKKKKKVSQ